jgi:DNA-binding NtrC family response regulator
MALTPLIIIIDDDEDFQAITRWMIEKQGYVVEAYTSHSAMPEYHDHPTAMLLDWQLGGEDGTELIQVLRRRFPSTPVLLVTGFSSPEIAATAIKRGAFDFLAKPIDEARLIASLAKAVEHHDLLDRLMCLEGQDGENEFEGMIGASPQMRTVFSAIQNIAPTDVNVMIIGESGTGKELAANAIHRRSTRSSGPFVAQNMASIPHELVEATLFGHERGAFTGADRKRPGLVGEAQRGTLFLDEVTEMPLDLQPKLLRFLQEQTYRSVGASDDRKSDVRIVSATNRDPKSEVDGGRFRADLYYRLNVVPIELPPLREREGDIALLANYAVRQFSEQHGKAFQGVDEEALHILMAYEWPGNVRQLFHLMQRVVLISDGEVVQPHNLPTEVFEDSTTQSSESIDDDSRNRAAASESREVGVTQVGLAGSEIIPLIELERQAIEHALSVCKGSAYEAARRLGISTATIYRKIRLYQLTV